MLELYNSFLLCACLGVCVHCAMTLQVVRTILENGGEDE